MQIIGNYFLETKDLTFDKDNILDGQKKSRKISGPFFFEE
jgi:hypothetical protein